MGVMWLAFAWLFLIAWVWYGEWNGMEWGHTV
jgi:hypothetical protein